MNTSRHHTVTTVLALTLSLGIAACSEDDPTVEPPATDPSASTTEDAAPDEATADDATPDQGSAETSGAGEATGDLTTTALTAIGTAEAEAGGTAYEIDDQDADGTWEVDVRVEDRSVEVTVSADGSRVERTEEDDLDDDDRAALDAATITLAEAIELAVSEAGGVLDDAELEGEDDGRPHHWEVTVDTGGTETEVLVDVAGEILGAGD